MIARFSLNAEDKDSAEARNARYDQLKHQIADYYAVESPWKGADVELAWMLNKVPARGRLEICPRPGGRALLGLQRGERPRYVR